MRLNSVYVVICYCGREVEFHGDTATCTKCGKTFRLEVPEKKATTKAEKKG